MKSRALLVFILGLAAVLRGDGWTAGGPAAQLVRTEAVIRFPGPVDSNSPAFWSVETSQPELVVLNSVGHSLRSSGPELTLLSPGAPIVYSTVANGRRWMESIIQDEEGTLYGYYHNEPAGVCSGSGKTAPRIGAARSIDLGRTWQDLGIVLEASPSFFDCGSENDYFVGGVGDFTAVLDSKRQEVYFFYTSYSGGLSAQGIGAARMLWADRDAPRGNLAVWRLGLWEDASPAEASTIFKNGVSWHEDGKLGAFWGPSVHWNTYLQSYVMLLNRSEDASFSQEGIYVSFAPSLEDPLRWSTPVKILDRGEWYPQVIGLEPGEGTDKRASETARFFLGGRSEYLIKFSRF